MTTLTNNLVGGTAVASASRLRGRVTGYPTASWSATAVFGCFDVPTMGHADHKSTRPRPLEPSQ